jgi:hypothetical protein
MRRSNDNRGDDGYVTPVAHTFATVAELRAELDGWPDDTAVVLVDFDGKDWDFHVVRSEWGTEFQTLGPESDTVIRLRIGQVEDD